MMTDARGAQALMSLVPAKAGLVGSDSAAHQRQRPPRPLHQHVHDDDNIVSLIRHLRIPLPPENTDYLIKGCSRLQHAIDCRRQSASRSFAGLRPRMAYLKANAMIEWQAILHAANALADPGHCYEQGRNCISR